MCTFFDEIAKEGREEGKAGEIVETGLEFHPSDQEILDRLQRKLDLSLSKAREYFHRYSRQTVWLPL